MTKSGYLKIALIICFLSLVVKAPAPGFQVVYIHRTNPINPYALLINAVVKVESSGDTLAYNLIEEAVGAFQIRPIRILDYNQRTGKNYKIEDCYNYKISKEIFLYYATLKGNMDFESISRNWNGSGKATLDYWEKVRSLL